MAARSSGIDLNDQQPVMVLNYKMTGMINGF